jgi:hypothetical protein
LGATPMSSTDLDDRVEAMPDRSSQEAIEISVGEGCSVAMQALRQSAAMAEPDVSDRVSSNFKQSCRQDLESSSCRDCEGRVSDTACPSQLHPSEWNDLLHELSNLLTGILLNIQLLGWKLPPYSHLKRPVREAERNAQRSAEILKRLIRCRSDAGVASPGLATNQPNELCELSPASRSSCESASYRHRPCAALQIATNQDPEKSKDDLTLACDGCTSSVVPKRDDGREGLQASVRQRTKRCRKGQLT